MPWGKENIALLREEFVRLATTQSDANISQLCQRFHISRKTGYKWINRAKHMRVPKFTDRKSAPHTQHKKVTNHIKEQIITARCLHPHWGAKKIKAYLLNIHAATHLPAISTINKILAKEGLLRIHQHERHYPYKRFQHTRPNELWQMDFKGYFSLLNGVNCHPLTIIDDCSRFTERINDISMNHLSDAQEQFDLWGHQYNHFRPHEALAMQLPITAYQISPRKFSEELPPIAYWKEDVIRLVDYNGYVYINKRKVLVSKALRGQPVAIRVSKNGELLHIFFCQRIVKTINNLHDTLRIKRGGRGHNIFA